MTAGVTQYRGGEAVEATMRLADTALYIGKSQGRDRVIVGPSNEYFSGLTEAI